MLGDGWKADRMNIGGERGLRGRVLGAATTSAPARLGLVHIPVEEVTPLGFWGTGRCGDLTWQSGGRSLWLYGP